jgi:hypothetical protein
MLTSASDHQRGRDFRSGRPIPLIACGTLPENLVPACLELIVQSVDLPRLIGRDIPLMQRPQLIYGWAGD